MAGPGDGFHVEQLPGVVLHAAEHHHGDGVALLLDHFQDVLRPQCVLALETPTTCSVSQSVTVLIFAGRWCRAFWMNSGNLSQWQICRRKVVVQTYRSWWQAQHAFLGVVTFQANLRLDSVLRRIDRKKHIHFQITLKGHRSPLVHFSKHSLKMYFTIYFNCY